MNRTNPKVDFYFSKAKKWHEEIEQLRTIILDCGLTEELKWGCPCYTFEKSNIVLIHVFKEYCALLFFKGSLLKDAKGILGHAINVPLEAAEIQPPGRHLLRHAGRRSTHRCHGDDLTSWGRQDIGDSRGRVVVLHKQRCVFLTDVSVVSP